MEVILREDVENLGARGALVKVADGYARNFLLPKRLAVAATASNKKIVEQEKEAHLRREAKAESEAQDLARMMNNTVLKFRHRVGENDQLFGSVTAKDIAEALEAQSYTSTAARWNSTSPSNAGRTQGWVAPPSRRDHRDHRFRRTRAVNSQFTMKLAETLSVSAFPLFPIAR